MDPWVTAVLLFVGYFFYDLLYAQWAIQVAKKNAALAAHISVGIYLIGSYGTITMVNNYWLVLPIILGAWLGTYVAVRRDAK